MQEYTESTRIQPFAKQLAATQSLSVPRPMSAKVWGSVSHVSP
jgi:hypothetical protein